MAAEKVVVVGAGGDGSSVLKGFFVNMDGKLMENKKQKNQGFAISLSWVSSLVRKGQNRESDIIALRGIEGSGPNLP